MKWLRLSILMFSTLVLKTIKNYKEYMDGGMDWGVDNDKTSTVNANGRI